MENEFMANIQQEGLVKEPAKADEKEKETPSESPAEKEPKDSKPAAEAEGKEKDETPEPEKTEEPAVFNAFHKHPRWIAMQSELGELREFREKVSPLLDNLEKSPKAEEKTNAPDWFTELFGENPEAWAKYRQYDNSQRQQLRKEILDEVRAEEGRKAQEQKKMDAWVD